MQWISTGRRLGQAVKNAQRLQQIIRVFARHGFADVLNRMNLEKYFPSKRLTRHTTGDPTQSTQERLKCCFEELGPTFVKLGQVLSSRSDLIPEEFTEEFTKLQDNVQPLPYETVKQVLESELGRKLTETFAHFSETPLAAASIGQVHEATLPTGEKVVVKIQRPGIDKIIATDVSLLAFLARLLERYIPESRIFRPTTIVDEFFKTLAQELDFIIEANNMSKIAEYMIAIPEIVIPKVYKNLSTSKVLTLEKFDGIRVNDLKALEAAGVDRKFVVKVGARAFFKSILIDGLFHGDLHGGNLFVLPGNRLGLIDFGIVGRLSQKSRDQLANMMMALVTEDYETLCYQYAELGAAGASVDLEGFQREIRHALSPYMGLSLKEINAGKILIETTKIAAHYNIQVPGDWMTVFKAIYTIEGMGRALDPDFDLIATSEELVKELIKNQYSVQRISKDFLWAAKDIASLLQVLPRQIRWMFRKFNSNDFAFEITVPELKALRRQTEINGRRAAIATLAGSFAVAGSLALNHAGEHEIAGLPAAAVVFFGLAAVLAIRALISKN